MGNWFNEGIDRLFLHNRGYNYKDGTWDHRGVWEGLAQTGLGMLNPGLGLVGGKLMDRYNNGHPQGGTYDGGGFFDGGASMGGNSGFGGSALGGYSSGYGGQMPGEGMFGTGYGSGNLFGNNPYNVDAFGQPIGPTQVGPFGNTQSAPGGGNGGGGDAGGGMSGRGTSNGPAGRVGINSGGNRFSGGLYAWGQGGDGPNYT